MKKKIVFVILQYGAYVYTKRCIESIYKNVINDFHIIVVDNSSPDDALSLLRSEYADKQHITIIESEHNLGFSKGNNLGFIYAKKEFWPEYIVLLNNDTELLDDTFVDKVEQEYNYSHFAVLGPMILTGDGKYTSNPSRVGFWSEENIKKCIRTEKIFLQLEKMNLGFCYDMFVFVRQILKKKSTIKSIDNLKRQENVELHGSFMIFSKEYVSKFDGLDERTFMYSEEPILRMKLQRNNLLSVYNPTLKIYHAEDAATNGAYKKGKAKRIFYFKKHIESCEILLDVMKET